ncbi:MAG: amino acid adenylation domain-containing protein, partial [Planctomyces sp.]|nr:amino acid adenylation domain-containing protein [Planctomyces sp.]
PEGHKDARYLESLIQQHQATLIHFVPSMLAVFLSEVATGGNLPLKRIFCSGEALPEETRNQTLKLFPKIVLSDLYGPTEAAVHVSSMSWTMDSLHTRIPPTIGRPVANTQLYVVDAQLQLLPPGQEGELLIGGVQVARGYWNRPELTAEKFIADHFSKASNALLYRTGDLCRWQENGTVEYLGRIDHQVKIRGFRIELGEVEAAINQHPAIHSCVVVPDQPGTPQASLHAWLIRQNGTTSNVTTATELRAFLTIHLPEYMIPTRFFEVESFPLSPNGKLDRRALAAMKALELPSGRGWKNAESIIEQEVLAVC